MKPIVTFILIFFLQSTFAQLGLKGVLFSPTGDFGFTHKKTLGAELIWKVDFKKPFRMRFFVNAAQHQPRLDTIRTITPGGTIYAVKYGPGYITYNKLLNVTAGLGVDYSPQFMSDWKIRPYLGVDIDFGVHYFEYESKSGFDIYASTKRYSLLFGGGVIRVGGEMNFKKMGVFFDISRCYNLVVEEPVFGFTYTAYGIGINYNFK